MNKRNPASVPSASSTAPRFLYISAAVCGAAIMIVEILGAKMLAPYVGTSHFVWTAQIAVTLIALAVGYSLGGAHADRTPRLAHLYGAILIAAVYLAIVTVALRPVALACLRLDLALGSFVASAVLFFVPLSLLAVTTPFLARVLTSSLTSVGASVGRLTAVSTLGSFAGTLLIGYLLIPFLPNTVTLSITAGTLALLSLAYFGLWHRRQGHMAGVVAALLTGTGAATAGWHADQKSPIENARLLFRGNSNFGEMKVVEALDGRYRLYLNDLLVQNTYDPVLKTGVSEFTYVLHALARDYTPKLERALCIGMGIGLVPANLAADGVEVDVVEINPRVPTLARDYFDCPVEDFNVIIADGRQFLNATTNRYDTVILDAFLGDSSPSHLMSREAFQAMHDVLRPNGTLVMNFFADFRTGRDFLGCSLVRTLESVFRRVKLHSSGHGNGYLLASDRDPLDPLVPPQWESVHPAVRRRVELAYQQQFQVAPGRGRILLDDFNPAEVWDAANREEIRRQLTRSLQSL